jgi:hypothetical protein
LYLLQISPKKKPSNIAKSIICVFRFSVGVCCKTSAFGNILHECWFSDVSAKIKVAIFRVSEFGRRGIESSYVDLTVGSYQTRSHDWIKQRSRVTANKE